MACWTLVVERRHVLRFCTLYQYRKHSPSHFWFSSFPTLRELQGNHRLSRKGFDSPRDEEQQRVSALGDYHYGDWTRSFIGTLSNWLFWGRKLSAPPGTLDAGRPRPAFSRS